MIDERVLEALLSEIADEIPVPERGTQRVLDSIAASSPNVRNPSRFPQVLAVAAAVVVVGGLSLLIANGSSSRDSKSAAVRVQTAGGAAKSRLARPETTPTTIASGSPSAGPLDSAKIVKTGTLDLRVPRGALRVTVNRVSGAAIGLGGYIAAGKTNYDGRDPTAQVTIRVPVDDFETAIGRLRALPGVTVLSDSENGVDVTAQYADLQAQLGAATAARNQLLVVLSRAETIGDILAVQDRVSAVQKEIDQLQGRINVLGDQATFSSLAVTLSEKSARSTAAQQTKSTGLAAAWSDARQGFSNSVEWLIARSGGALIVLLAALALLFGIRYLYPILRRGLL
jgi:hypothetical protein